MPRRCLQDRYEVSETTSFQPRFRMPVIAPPPPDYAGDAEAYYADVEQQSGVVAAPIAIEPEEVQAAPNASPANGMKVTLSNPNGVFQYVPTGISVPAPPPAPWRTLFAMMGGQLRYVPSTDPAGLNAQLPPLYDSLPSPFTPQTPAGLLTSSWGTLVLRLWGADVMKMQARLDGAPACGVIYYVGVDETSLNAAVEPVVHQLFPATGFASSIAGNRTPALRLVVEEILSAPYAQPPSYAQVVADYVAQFVAGKTSLLVPGGTPIGTTVLLDPGGGAAPGGEILLWAVDSGQAPAFADINAYFGAGAAIP
jgi:hypothetical protein